MRIFDAHFHVIDPRFPLVPNQGYVPDRFTVDDYVSRVSVDGGAVVSGSFQAYDQTYGRCGTTRRLCISARPLVRLTRPAAAC